MNDMTQIAEDKEYLEALSRMRGHQSNITAETVKEFKAMDLPEIAGNLSSKKQDDKAVSDTLGYLALFLIGLAWIGPFIVHMIGYHLYQFITVVLRIPLGSKTSDIVLIGMIVSLAALLLSSVLYWLLKKYGY